jgi:tellurite resistance protein TehA-like permease
VRDLLDLHFFARKDSDMWNIYMYQEICSTKETILVFAVIVLMVRIIALMHRIRKMQRKENQSQ